MILFFLIIYFCRNIFCWNCQSVCDWTKQTENLLCLSLKNENKNSQNFDDNKFRHCTDNSQKLTHIYLEFFNFRNEKITKFNFSRNVYSFHIYSSNVRDLVDISSSNIGNHSLVQNEIEQLTRNDSLPDTLEELDLSHNKIKLIEKGFFLKFSKLKKIILVENNLQKIDTLIFNSNKLNLIDFTNNKIYKFKEINFKTHPDSLNLNISGNNLRKLMYLTGSITHLAEFHLGRQNNYDLFYKQNSMILNENVTIKIDLFSFSYYNLDYDIPNEFICFLNSDKLAFKNIVDYNFARKFISIIPDLLKNKINISLIQFHKKKIDKNSSIWKNCSKHIKNSEAKSTFLFNSTNLFVTSNDLDVKENKKETKNFTKAIRINYTSIYTPISLTKFNQNFDIVYNETRADRPRLGRPGISTKKDDRNFIRLVKKNRTEPSNVLANQWRLSNGKTASSSLVRRKLLANKF
ncbi:unnamed protein product [Brachionus calyciflorus]|uniref:Uncharacterized protein n=1 Tax=Brachionus calyciflorus TaxID=104777 RepID=A0A813M202_9BILA|nr:unnamed protein product [Brachionus calyciflorus]